MKKISILLAFAFCFSTSLAIAQEVALKLKKPLTEADFKKVQSILRSFDNNSYKLVADVRTSRGLKTARIGNQGLYDNAGNAGNAGNAKTRVSSRNSKLTKASRNRGLANVKQVNTQVYLNRSGYAAATNTKYNIFRQLKAAGTNTEWNIFKAMGTNTKYNIFKQVAATNTKYNIFKPTNRQLSQMDALYRVLAKYQ